MAGEKLAWKDRLPVTFSVFAFAISALGAYFNYLDVSDDVSLVLSGGMTVELADKEQLSADANGTTVAIINSGNRSAAMLGIAFFVCQWGKCGESMPDQISTEF
jgi:hypothetical protein